MKRQKDFKGDKPKEIRGKEEEIKFMPPRRTRISFYVKERGKKKKVSFLVSGSYKKNRR